MGFNLGQLVETLFARFLHCKVTLYSAVSILYPLEGSHYTWLTCKKLEVILLKSAFSYRLSETVLHRGFVYSVQFIFFNQLITSVWIHRCLIYTLGYNAILLYFVSQLVSSSPLGVFPVGPSVP